MRRIAHRAGRHARQHDWQHDALRAGGTHLWFDTQGGEEARGGQGIESGDLGSRGTGVWGSSARLEVLVDARELVPVPALYLMRCGGGWGIRVVVPTFVGNLAALAAVARPLTIALLVG